MPYGNRPGMDKERIQTLMNGESNWIVKLKPQFVSNVDEVAKSVDCENKGPASKELLQRSPRISRMFQTDINTNGLLFLFHNTPSNDIQNPKEKLMKRREIREKLAASAAVDVFEEDVPFDDRFVDERDKRYHETRHSAERNFMPKDRQERVKEMRERYQPKRN